MKLILMFYVLLYTTINCKSQVINCEKFKTGKFQTKNIPVDYGYTLRKKNVQKSYYKKNNMVITWQIKWSNDCTYELTFESEENGDGTFKKGDRIVANITSIVDDCYSFTAIFYNDKYPSGKILPQGEMCIIKD